MRTLLASILIGSVLSCGATTYTEFCVRPDGDNLNAGSTTNAAAVHTYAGGTFVRATGVYTVASGDPAADGVVAGDWASVYTTAGATVAKFVALVTGRDATTITVSTTAIAGVATDVSEAANATTCKVGGAWLGPNTTVGFPFGFATATLTNASGNVPCINFQNSADYSVTAAMTADKAGPIVWQGYTNTFHDGGRATIAGPAAATSFIVLTVTGANNDFWDFIFANNGNSGSATGVSVSGAEAFWGRCVVHGMHRTGMNISSAGGTLWEFEAYDNNRANSAGHAGIIAGLSPQFLLRCISHDNAGNNSVGISVTAAAVLDSCIIDTNGKDGIAFTAATTIAIKNCDIYNNTGSGLDLTGTTATQLFLENCNFVKNGAYAVNSTGSAIRNGLIVNCGLGSGTQTNTSGFLGPNMTGGTNGVSVIGTVTFAADQTPWSDPANGDFRITLDAAKASGRGTFTETAASYTGSISYPRIGAVQGAATNAAAASGGSYTFAQ